MGDYTMNQYQLEYIIRKKSIRKILKNLTEKNLKVQEIYHRFTGFGEQDNSIERWTERLLD